MREQGQPIRVMRVITRLNIGGPSYQAIYLNQRLHGNGFECALVAGDVAPSEGSMEGLAAERGVPIIHLEGLGREVSPASDGLTVARLYSQMRRFRPDIVHTHQAKAGAVGRLAARLARVPVLVHTYHGHVFHGYFSERKSEVFVRIERALARWTDRIVVLGESQEREILGFGVGRAAQMVRIPLGLELEPFLAADEHRGALRRELGIESAVPLVGIVARLVPVKAHHLFLDAAREVARSVPQAQFLIVGDGELRESLEEQAIGAGMAVRRHDRSEPVPVTTTGAPVVHFLGFRSDLAAIYADLDVVVLCSVNEGLPVTLIEALAAARPVVATDVGEVRDLVVPGETGLLTPAGEPGALARGIVEQIQNPGRAVAMALRGRSRVHPRLSIDRLEADIRRLYFELAAQKSLISANAAPCRVG